MAVHQAVQYREEGRRLHHSPLTLKMNTIESMALAMASSMAAAVAPLLAKEDSMKRRELLWVAGMLTVEVVAAAVAAAASLPAQLQAQDSLPWPSVPKKARNQCEPSTRLKSMKESHRLQHCGRDGVSYLSRIAKWRPPHSRWRELANVASAKRRWLLHLDRFLGPSLLAST